MTFFFFGTNTESYSIRWIIYETNVGIGGDRYGIMYLGHDIAKVWDIPPLDLHSLFGCVQLDCAQFKLENSGGGV